MAYGYVRLRPVGLTDSQLEEFDTYTQTPLTPDDDALVSPTPYGGLYLPDGGTVAVEGALGAVTLMTFPVQTWFYGLLAKRIREFGTDAGIRIFGLSRGSLTTLRATTGDRQADVALSDTALIAPAPVGGIYITNGGLVRYLSASGLVKTQNIAPQTWIPGGEVLRINLSGTRPDLIATAFTR